VREGGKELARDYRVVADRTKGSRAVRPNLPSAVHARLSLLGEFTLSIDGVTIKRPSTKKARALVAFLALNRRADVARDRLVELLWPGAEVERGRDNLKAALWSIRRSLREAGIDADGCVRADRSVVRWLPETEIDVERFEALAARGESASDAEAVALYAGDFLEGDYDDWPSLQRAALSGRHEETLARGAGASDDITAIRKLLERNPYDEDAYARLIEYELRNDRSTSAAAYAERYRTALRALGDAASPEFEERFGSLSTQVRSLEIALPFSGRAAELAAIAEMLEDAKGGAGGIILLHGDAGIGKSTLVERASRLAGDVGLTVVTVRCVADDPRTLGPWPGAFATLTGRPLAQFVQESAGALVPTIAGAIASSMPEGAMLVVEDVHALSGDAFDIAVAVAEQSASRHLTILTTRPEGVRELGRALAGASPRELALGTLSREELGSAVASATGMEQAELENALWERSKGHPLFASSLLATLAARGTLKREGRAWRWRAGVEPLELPDDLRRFILTRLRSAGDDGFALAGTLALDPLATADDLVAVLAFGEDRVFDGLDELLSRAIVVESRDGATFAFGHDLIREVALGTLNPGRRAALHRAFAMALDGQVSSELSIRRARHFRGAGRPLEAADWYLRAAQDALAWGAGQEARARIDEAIASVEPLEGSSARDIALSRLRALAARVAASGGSSAEAVHLAADATAFARSSGSEIDIARSLLVSALIAGQTFRFAEQRAYATEAAELAARNAALDLQAASLVQMSIACRSSGERDAALRLSGEAEATARACHAWALVQTALTERLRTQITWWDLDAAAITLKEAFDPSLRLERIAHATSLQARAEYWRVIDQPLRAEADLRLAETAMLEEGQRRLPAIEPSHSLPAVRFAGILLHGQLAVRRRAWDEAVFDLAQMEASPLSAIQGYAQLAALLQIEILLGRADDGDAARAASIADRLSDEEAAQSLLGWSDSPALARACVAARLRRNNAGSLLRMALNVTETHARQTPLLADLAFERLAAAADEVDDEPVHARAILRAQSFAAMRKSARRAVS
jgi:DNA-binding SARP family transcriptional activator